MRARIIVQLPEGLQLRMQRPIARTVAPAGCPAGATAPGGGSGAEAAPKAASWNPPDARRQLQLGLAFLWLLDAVLQCQSYMFTPAFGRMLAASADGNPAAIAQPIGWAARIVTLHPGPVNAAFASIQLLIAAGIAWRPAIKAALAASVAWSLGVWWLGEGLGGLLAGTASPVTGAPGAVLLYALLAALLWPADKDPASPFPAGRGLGRNRARCAWLLLWGGLALLSLTPAARAPHGLHDMITQMTSGEPGWLAAAGNAAAAVTGGHGLLAPVVLCAIFAGIAAAVVLPVFGARAMLIVAIIVAAAIWVAGEQLGGLFTGTGTDPNTGPPLALLAVAYWPMGADRRRLA